MSFTKEVFYHAFLISKYLYGSLYFDACHIVFLYSLKDMNCVKKSLIAYFLKMVVN